MKRVRVLAVMLLALCLVAGCATTGVKSWTQKSPIEKADTFLSQYNTQYRDTMRLATDPKSTPAQKQVAITKKKILTEVYPLIGAYANLAAMGQAPTQTQEDEILDLLNKLGGSL